MTCTHDIAARESVVADGCCPLCMADEIERLRERELQAIRLINAAFGEYACAASKVLPEGEIINFEAHFAVPARKFLGETQY